MSKITLSKISYKNFRSVGNDPIVINLNKHHTTLISGTNGNGKSTLLHALCFGLFGRGYGNVSKPSLINSINQKQLSVEVEFEIATKKYKVVRGMKPSVFEIYENDVLINQDAATKDYQKVLEQQILKFNYRAFTQVVAVGGSDYVPFMKLSAKDRREFVEDLLDIRVFSTMNTLIKDKVKTLKDDLKTLELTLTSKKEKILLQQSFIDKMNKEKSESTDVLLAHVSKIQKENDKYQNEVVKLLDDVAVSQKRVDTHEALDDKLTEVRLSQKSLVKQLESKREKATYYASLSHCPTCDQSVSSDHRASIVSKYDDEVDSFVSAADQLVKDELALKVAIKELDDDLILHTKLQQKISELNKLIFANNAIIKNSNDQLAKLESNTDNVDEENAKLKAYAKEYITETKDKKELLETQQYQDFVLKMLSDSGIKSKIIQQYIPTINKLINKYLAELDLFLSFHLDEQFNETIKSRHRDTFTYDNFSDGQKRRIDIAVLLTWMEIAKAKNALHVNIVLFDEIDAALDREGSDLLHATLKTCSAENIFLVSHKADLLADRVDFIINFQIKNNFTIIS